MVTQSDPLDRSERYKFQIYKIQDGGGRHLKKKSNKHHISAAIQAISIELSRSKLHKTGDLQVGNWHVNCQHSSLTIYHFLLVFVVTTTPSFTVSMALPHPQRTQLAATTSISGCDLELFLFWVQNWDYKLRANRGSYALYRMALFPVTLSDPYLPQTISFFDICSALHIFVVGGDKELKLGRLVDCTKC